jgi:hypothetical protein
MIRIGVIGHRFLADIPKLIAGIDLALSRVAQAYPDETWSVVSSLAEGADRLVVQRILLIRPEARLIVPLPLPVLEYTQDFSSESSRKEFQGLMARAAEVIPPPRGKSHSEGYWLAGKTILERIDVLIALWDGQSSMGQGGTGKIVAMARQKKLPLAWVKCGNRVPGTNEAVSLGHQQGQVSFERIKQD